MADDEDDEIKARNKKKMLEALVQGRKQVYGYQYPDERYRQMRKHKGA